MTFTGIENWEEGNVSAGSAREANAHLRSRGADVPLETTPTAVSRPLDFVRTALRVAVCACVLVCACSCAGHN